MSDDFEFVDEPPAAKVGAPHKWVSVVEKLRADPGHWAIVKRGQSRGAASVIVDRLKNHYRCEATQRVLESGEHVVYARWPVDAP